MRASRILSSRPERAIIALAQLCEEREDELVRASPAQHTFNHTPPRLASFPAQTPYTVGASRRPTTGDRLSPPMKLFDRPPKVADPTHTRSASEDVVENSNIPPEHMAPKRGKWTSPPPVDAPPAIQVSYENTLGLGLTLATAATPARERESMSYTSSSSNNSEVMTDDDGGENGPASDPDLLFNEPETPSSPSNKMGAHSFGVSPSPSGSKSSSNFMDPRHVGRGRPSRAEAYAVEMARQGSDIGIPPSPTTEHQQRRSASGPPRTSWHIQPSIATPQLSLAPLVPPSPLTTQIQPRNSPSPTYRFSPIEPPRAMHIPHRQVLPDPVAIPVAPILYWDRQHHHFATQPLRQTAPRHRPQPFPLYQQIQSASSSPSNRNARPSTPPSSREQKREGPSSLPIQSRSMSQSASTSPLQIKVTLESTSAPHHSRSSVPPPSYSSIAGTSRRSSESGQFNARSPSSQSAASPTSTRLSFDSNVESSSSGSSTRAPCGPNFSPSPPAITPSPPPENRQSPISSPPLPPSAPHSNSSPGSNGAARSVIIPSPSARTAHKRKISDDQGITATATKPPHYESMISAMSKLGLKEKR
jgi:terminal uridylyltransferase